jgi:hypothetical protein
MVQNGPEKSLRFQSNAELIDQRQLAANLICNRHLFAVLWCSVAAATKVSLAVFRVSMFLFVGVVLAAQSTPAGKPQKPRIKPAHFGDIGQQFGLRALTLTDVAAAARRLNRLHHGLQWT